MKKIFLCLFCGILTMSLITGCENLTTKKTNNNSNNSDLEEKQEDKDVIYNGNWGTQSAVSFNDAKYGLLNIVGYGNYTYKITVKTPSNIANVDEQVRSAILYAFDIVISKSGNDFYDLVPQQNKIKTEILKTANAFLPEDIEITNINILSIKLTKESEKIVNEKKKQEILNQMSQ